MRAKYGLFGKATIRFGDLEGDATGGYIKGTARGYSCWHYAPLDLLQVFRIYDAHTWTFNLTTELTATACTDGQACGNRQCDGVETCSTCPEDCGFCGGAHCGDTVCSGGETCGTCPADCDSCEASDCGNGYCEVAETCDICPTDCGACLAYGCEGQGDGSRCSDGNQCTKDDTCIAGVCVGATVTCEASDDCHLGVCNSLTGCAQVPASDGATCGAGGRCETGECVGTTCEPTEDYQVGYDPLRRCIVSAPE